jgi:4-amino-4-deoxy-L-arabinose transferase-like glycosyltransferase
LRILFTYLIRSNSIDPTLAAVLVWAAALLYVYFLFRSFMDHQQFYRLTGDEYGTSGALIYFFVGMPLYIVMFFFFRNQMKDRMGEMK